MRAGARDAIPLAIAVGLFGVAFGVLARAGGLGAWAPIAMSATTYGGSAQFAAISVLGDGGGLAAAVTSAVLLNARYGPIGVSIAPSLGRMGIARRFALSQLVVDESWAVATDVNGRTNPARLFGAGLAIYVAWLAGTVVGVTAGDLLADPDTLGFDAAFPALFLALLLPRLRDRRAAAAAAIGAGVALVLIPFARPGVPILAATVGALAGWRRR